jgi:tetratricopeptide (TPR) repeat protein
MAAYGLTIFTGAFLLFQVQPLIGKYILPWFGGAPSVWTTCMLFFQVVLLAGYGYAHLASRRLNLKWQASTQLALTAAAVCFLPAIPSDSWKPNGTGDPTWRIIGLLSATIGLPYLVLAATSPLLQHWFARTNSGKSPYRLYALSNVGSLLALASYPTLFEPHFTRQAQASIWASGLVAYGLGLGLCARKVWATSCEPRDRWASSPSPAPHGEVESDTPASRLSSSAPEKRGRLGFDVRPIFWIALPSCASAFLLATTNRMCQEVAVVPFLWVVPLGLYLLSFIICFDSPRWYRRFPFGVSLAAVMGGVCWALFHWSTISVPVQMCIYGAACFICCMVCHGEVYRLRPDPKHLTGFYLLVALGGALGGIFVGVVSPVIFNDYFELQWGLALCGLLFLLLVANDWRSGQLKSWRWKPVWLANWGAVACGALGVAWVGMVVAFWVQARQQGPITVCKTRNFYGVLTVFERTDPRSDVRFAKLLHGRTAHGFEFKDPVRAKWPTLYYNEKSGVGLAMQELPPGPKRIGIVGLGIGTLATYGQVGDYLRLYEINPSVVSLARSQFSYLTNCHAQAEVVLGDARLSLEKEPPQEFDLLVLDAFSSDAIPVHLLTEEAFRLYQRHLKSGGILAVHVSNLSLDLEPVVANVASRLGYVATMVDYRPPVEKWWVCRSKWVLLSKGEAGLRLGRCCRDARPARTDLVDVPLWTDDFTSLFRILWRPSAWGIVPSTAELELRSALQLAEHKNIAGAIEHYRAALEAEPDLTPALNNLAWILATDPDASLRNGAEAVQCARRSCELTSFRTTILVGTLAAAYAEAGQFDQAVATAEKACQLASKGGDTALLQRNQQLLALYREGKPARD